MADRTTNAWLWGALLTFIGLPLLVVVLLFVYRHELVDTAVSSIPVDHEVRFAGELWQLQRSQFRLVEGTLANRFLDEVGQRLVRARATPYRYQFHLADDPAVNAFAMPGGYVVVHRGLIESASSAEEVAGVLAHEIEHIEQRHSLRAMVQAAGLATVWTLVSGDLLGGATGEWLRHLAGLQFSRDQEIQADGGGYGRLVAAGIDPRGMVSFFDRLAEDQGALPGAFSMLSTHPASEERSARLKELLDQVPAFAPLDYDWPRIQASLASASDRSNPK